MRWPVALTAVAGALVGAAAIAATPASTLFTADEATAGPEPGGERWACPMMDFIGRRAGPCPMCGMAMERMGAGDLSLEQTRRMGLETVAVREGPAVMTVRAAGTAMVDDRLERLVIARVAGRVVKRHIALQHVGSTVAVGDPLIDLYSAEALAAQAELQAAVRRDDAVAMASIRKRFARWNLDAVADAVVAGGEPLDTVTIRSPFPGEVSGHGEDGRRMLPRLGQEIAADQPVATLVNHHHKMVKIHVPEPWAHWLRVGQPVAIASDDGGEWPDSGAEVSWLARWLDAETRAREVHLHVHDDEDRIFDGSLVQARIRVALGPDLKAADPGDERAWGRFPLIPEGAVLSTGVRHVAWREEAAATRAAPGRFAPVQLVLGPRLEGERGDDWYVVRSGLKPGDRVAAQGAFLIDSQAQLAGTASLLFPDGAP